MTAIKDQRKARAKQKYRVGQLVMLFFTFSFLGFLWEIGLRWVVEGELVKRGTLVGPWLPIYGAGGVLAVCLLRRVAERPVLTYLASCVLCAGIEYGTSWYLERIYGLRWWDYSGYFMNIHGRICLAAVVLFGLGCCTAIYFAAPSFVRHFADLPRRVRRTVSVVLVLMFALDFGWSTLHPNTGAGISDYPVSSTSQLIVIDPPQAVRLLRNMLK